MKKVSFLTLGCKVNQYETEAMMELFEEKGYKVTNTEENADIFIINTCTVTNLSARKSRQYISRARHINPQAIIAVVGCYSQTSPEEVENLDGVDIVIGTDNKKDIVKICEEVYSSNKKINTVKDDVSKDFEELSINNQEGMTRAYIKIQDGCNQFCSYCIIPFARGRIRSRSLDSIYREANRLGDAGYKEIVLTGIHVASYGLDMDENIGLIDAIRTVAKIDSIERIRLSSIEPRIITREFLEEIKSIGKVCDHFHMSLQSGADKILKLMNRKYNTEEYYEKVKLLREYLPKVGLTTDVIVGFPEETDEDFLDTCKFVEKVGFSKIHVFKYSPRKGTKAAKMKQIDGNIKKDRSNKLIKISDKLTKEFIENQFNNNLEVLFEEQTEEDIMHGYSSNYIRVESKLNKECLNNIVKVKPRKIKNEILIADIL